MLVSVICPLFNKETYIADTIESVLSQSFQRWELIIVDDGSTDSSLVIARKYADADNRIRIYQRSDFKSNKGGSVCRNIGIQLAKGNFILFLDADDLLAKNCLTDRIKSVNQFPGNDFYIFNHRSFYEKIGNFSSKERFIRLKNSIFSKFVVSERHFFVRSFAKYEILWQTSCILWTVAALTRLKGFTETFQRLQDPELHLRALLDEKISFQSFLYRTPPDVYIRLDPERRGLNNHLKHLKKHNDSVLFFLDFFYHYLKINKCKLRLDYFQGYILSSEQIFLHIWYSFPNDRSKLESLRKDFYSSEIIQSFISPRLKAMLSVYNFISRFGLVRKFKLNTAFLYCYKWML